MVTARLGGMLTRMAPLLSLDLGSTSTRVALAGKGVVLEQASAVTVHHVPHRPQQLLQRHGTEGHE